MPLAAFQTAELLIQSELVPGVPLVAQVLDVLSLRGRISAADRHGIESLLAQQTFPQAENLGNGLGVVRVHESLELAGGPVLALARLPENTLARGGADLRFMWFVFGAGPDDEELEPFGWMLHDPRFFADALQADTAEELTAVYHEYLRALETPEPLRSLPPELRPTEHFAGGLKEDVKRRWTHYGSDFSDGLHPKAIASTLFLYFAIIAPVVTFGALLNSVTGGNIGVIEVLVATAVSGVVYALTSGQPLTILGTTGPIAIFIGILYGLCDAYDVDFFQGYAWVGIWTTVLLVAFSVFELSRLIRFFTRFTDEIFAGLISLIFIGEALKGALTPLWVPDAPADGALLMVILCFGTYFVANQLSRFRRSTLLLQPMREFLADFGPAIAIFAMTAVPYWLPPVELDRLSVPATFATTTGRDWLVNPFLAPPWVIVASIGPALFASILLYLDQNITVRLVNAPDHQLQKGAGYHLDLLVVAGLVGLCSILGLPWLAAATVRSLNHVRSLATTESHGEQERIVSVRETRLTGLVVHLMIGASVFFVGMLGEIPMGVLFGLFLFMGIASMRGNQLFERLRLWFIDPAKYPPTHYVRRVPTLVMHAFTAIQIVCLLVLWLVKNSTLGILFPLFIGLLVPVRLMLDRFFNEKHLLFLDAEEVPMEEQERDLD